MTATGAATRFGDIVARLAARPPETEFERGTRRFGFLIMRTVIFLILFVLLVNIFLHREPLESLLFAVALAVGLTPEFLPMITSVTLARGAVRMARHQVIVKHLEAIQNLGSIDILCSDKTGTLTAGEMSLARVAATRWGRPRRASWSWPGSTPPRRPASGARSTRRCSRRPGRRRRRSGSSTRCRSTSSAAASPWSSSRAAGGCSSPRARPKACCPSARRPTGRVAPGRSTTPGAAGPRTSPASSRREGLRVIAVAWREVPAQAAYRAKDEVDLTFAGFVAFADPVLPDAREMVETLRRDGVEVKILTGDNELVARHVCADVGLDAGRLVAGDELDRLTDAALAAVAEQASVFARVSPAQKNRIIVALKQRGHVVGFLGDGINDAPSLHAADVGISVSSAVDVAREAADIILLERNLRVLHEGILEGRRSFGNVMKYLLMGTSSNFGNMFSMAAASLFLPFLPMLPTQILLNNFLYDLAQVTIPTDRVDPRFPAQAAALEHGSHPRLHDRSSGRSARSSISSRSACCCEAVQRVRVALPHRLVRRVARDADARALRHPHGGQPAAEPAEPAPRADDRRGGRRGGRASVFTGGRGARVRAAARTILRLPGGDRRRVPRVRRACQAPPAAPLRGGARQRAMSPRGGRARDVLVEPGQAG